MMSTIAFVLLIISAVIQVVFVLMKNEGKDKFSHFIILAAALLLFAVTITRSVQIRFVAVTNTFESLVFFAGVISLVLFLYKIQKKIRLSHAIVFGGLIIAIAMLAIASSPIAPKDIQPPVPALQSYWLVLHVTCAFIGESFFVLSFISSIIFLATKDEEKRKNNDRISYRAVAIGYPIFTVGALVFGAIWAKYAWGRYWSWDPKETWALITWLVYTLFLHSRFIKKMRGKGSAILSIIGFVFTVFTFFGVNFLLAGLHSYA
ncbi:MAG: c-type cytochrome biogenesis protein CcsB [Spirochaetales bacterium]|nr:MAG: c-type cytochrome biogenesis protein CcsB [Spirochaetales bacterium]